MPNLIRTFHLANTFDIVQARQCAREMARDLGFSLTDQTRIATAVSELARRLLDSSRSGYVRIAVVSNGLCRGLECACLGGAELSPPTPGSGGIVGGIERLVDELVIERGGGTEVTIVIRKWLRTPDTSPVTPRQVSNGQRSSQSLAGSEATEESVPSLPAQHKAPLRSTRCLQ